MKYTIKDILEKHTELNKSFIYDIIKSDNFEITYNFKWNRRLFTDKDIEVFLYIREEWNVNWLEKYWKKQIQTVWKKQIQTVWNNSDTSNKVELNEWKTDIINIEDENKINNEIIKENENLKIKDKENQELLKVREEMSQKYALLYKEERKDKEIMLEEKEKERLERIQIQKDYNWLSNKYNIFKIFFIILLCILIISLLININILTFNI